MMSTLLVVAALAIGVSQAAIDKDLVTSLPGTFVKPKYKVNLSAGHASLRRIFRTLSLGNPPCTCSCLWLMAVQLRSAVLICPLSDMSVSPTFTALRLNP